MNRRQFIAGLNAIGVVAAAGCRLVPRTATGASIRTVQGDIPADRMGVTLPHEHVLVDFIGAANVSRDRYDPDVVFEAVLPHLMRVAALGCRTLVECTPAYIGRDPRLLARLAVAAKINLLTNTGYYGASQNKFLPEHAVIESSDQLAERWTQEAHDGIERSGIRPGFIKIGVDSGPLSELHAKLATAAAKTHRRTGLTIAGHTGNGIAALGQLDIIESQGLSAQAFIWVHAQSESNMDLHARAAERGAWVEFDGIGPKSIAQHVKLVSAMRDRGLLHRVLISQDAGWYHVGEPGGGNFRNYETIFTEFLPALKRAEFTTEQISELMEQNPREAFSVRVRSR